MVNKTEFDKVLDSLIEKAHHGVTYNYCWEQGGGGGIALNNHSTFYHIEKLLKQAKAALQGIDESTPPRKVIPYVELDEE